MNSLIKIPFFVFVVFTMQGCFGGCKVKITKDYIYCKEWGLNYTPQIVIKEIKKLNSTANFTKDEEGFIKKTSNSEVDTSFIFRLYDRNGYNKVKDDTVFFTKKMEKQVWYKNWKEYEVDHLDLKKETWYFLDITNYHKDVYFYIKKNGEVVVREYSNDNW